MSNTAKKAVLRPTIYNANPSESTIHYRPTTGMNGRTDAGRTMRADGYRPARSCVSIQINGSNGSMIRPSHELSALRV
jgi:hypothetical protein